MQFGVGGFDVEDAILWAISAVTVATFIVKVLWKTTFIGAARRIRGYFFAHPVQTSIGWILGTLVSLFIIHSLNRVFPGL